MAKRNQTCDKRLSEALPDAPALDGPGPLKKGKNRVTKEIRQAAFLAAFGEACTEPAACEASGVGRSTHYDWLDTDPAYAKKFERAKRIAVRKRRRKPAKRNAALGQTRPPPRAYAPDTKKQARFLAAYALCGSIRKAARAAGVNRSTHKQQWMAFDPGYPARFAEAQEDADQELSDEARKRALKKSDRLLMFLIMARHPEYRPHQRIDFGRAPPLDGDVDGKGEQALKEFDARFGKRKP
jgi:hypothetical protein